MLLDEVRFIAATGALGVGVSQAALEEAMETQPHYIAADAGSSDAGPFSLGSGQPAFAREAVKSDLTIILTAAHRHRVPVLVGSAGTAGGDVHVDWTLDIVREICQEHALSLTTAVIYSEQQTAYLTDKLRQGRVLPLDPAPPLDEQVINRSTRIVGMMGVEPLQEALRAGADLVLAGRCSDAALYAALPIMNGLPEGLSWHAGKIAECGTLACVQAGPGVLTGTITHDGITLRPYGAGLRCTPQSIAAHSLYENADPYLFTECSGTFDLTDTVYTAIDTAAVRVTGSRFIPAETRTVKLEGAELAGYQSVMIGGVRDPLILQQLDHWLDAVRSRIEDSVRQVLGVTSYSLVFHVYGRDAVMGAEEPRRDDPVHEVAIVVEATAPTQELATAIIKLSRQPLLHHPIPEWSGAITGYACLHNPAHIERGEVYQFNLHHVVALDNPTEMFRTQLLRLGDPLPGSLPAYTGTH